MQRMPKGLASVVYEFFEKAFVTHKRTVINSNVVYDDQQLAEALHKLVFGKFKRHKAFPSFKDSIWVTNLAYMQLIRIYDKGIQFLLCTTDM